MNSTKTTNIRKCFPILVVLMAVFLITRLAVLFSYLDMLYETEELYHGTITHEIITGPVISPWEYLDYNVEYFPGGSLTAAILAVPFFLLFGHTYIALKLVGLSFALGAFILWFIFLGKFFNKKTALISALLFIFCMPFYTKTSLITWGSHPEANLFTILGFYLFYEIFFSGQEPDPGGMRGIYKRKQKYFFLLGLVFGFGLWFVQSYLLTILFLFLCWFIFDKAIMTRKAFFILFLGFLIGCSPLVYYALIYKTQVFNVNGSLTLLDFFIARPFHSILKLAALLLKSLPQSFLFVQFLSLPGEVYSYLYYLIFVTAFSYLLWQNRIRLLMSLSSLMHLVTLRGRVVVPEASFRETCLLMYPLIFFLLYSLSSYSVSVLSGNKPGYLLDYIGYRYMIPVIPFVMAIIAVFIGKIKKMPAVILLALLLALGIIANLKMVYLRNFGRFFTDKGYSYNVIADKIAFRGPKNLNDYIKPFMAKLDDKGRRRFYQGIGSGIAWRLKDKKPAEIIRAFEDVSDRAYRPCLYVGWGTLFCLEIPEEFAKAMEIAGVIPEEGRNEFYEGLGMALGFTDDIIGAVTLLEKIEPRYRPYCYKGLGFHIGFEYKNDPSALKSIIAGIEDRYRRYVLEGIPEGARER